MSWIFGYKKPVSDLPPPSLGGSGDGSSPPNNDGSSGNKSDQKSFAGRESIYKFDSTALERAAQAAKELERSRKFHRFKPISSNFFSLEYANQAFDVVKMQEQTKQLEIQKQMKVIIDH